MAAGDEGVFISEVTASLRRTFTTARAVQLELFSAFVFLEAAVVQQDIGECDFAEAEQVSFSGALCVQSLAGENLEENGTAGCGFEGTVFEGHGTDEGLDVDSDVKNHSLDVQAKLLL